VGRLVAVAGLVSCTSHPLAKPPASPVGVSDLYVSVAPVRKLDLVFMIDNSPSMAPKQEKLKAQFPRLMDALKDPADGSLPDLRVAILTSDLGTGGAYPSGSCGPKILADGTLSSFGDLGRFQTIGARDCGVTNPDARWLEYTGGKPTNYTGDISNVFACLAGNLGTLGCGEEHQLQAFEFALAAKGVGNEAQQAMLRPDAYLGLAFLSDEDDCSAATNDGMFGDKAELRGESASLRCATRAHACGGNNLSTTGPGYPTTSEFSAAFSSCAARTDACPNPTNGEEATDTSEPTSCSSLKSIKRMAEELKALKPDPDHQILVAGIFGWPLDDKDMAEAKYQIGLIPNPNTADTTHPQIYDVWPVCYDRNHLPADASVYDPLAAGWGAAGGLRLSAFVDEFGANGLKFSICESDFANAMRVFGNSLEGLIRNACIDEKLMDQHPLAPGVQANCRVAYRTPVPDPKDASKVSYEEDPRGMRQCDATASDDTQPAYPCWKLTSDVNRCHGSGQLISVVRAPSERAIPLTPGTKLAMQCETCVAPVAGMDSVAGCDY
jgi:hypothetical protein